MGNALLATTALAFVSSPALAADKLSVGVGGYMQQWFGHADRDDMSGEGGFDVQSDSEVYFQGSMESDMGLKFGVHVQLEANQDGNKAAQIDESFAHVSGDFGRLEIGARDPIHARTHYGISDVGVGLNAGDTQKWIPGAYLDTNGWIGDNLNVIYISPRVSGVQVGLSYGADSASESSVTSAPKNNDNQVWAAGINFNQSVGDASVKFSLGHRVGSMPASSFMVMTGMDEAGADLGKDDLTVGVYKGHQDALEAYEKAKMEGSDNLNNAASAASTANMAIKAAQTTAMAGDDDTFTNVGVGVGFGAFSFNVAYAERDKGAYKVMESFKDENGDGMKDDDDKARSMVVKDKAGEWDVIGVSVSYTDGPMSVSLGHMMHETGAGTEREATMFSASYGLAPGVAWKSSIFQVEDDTGSATAEGTGIVTGITLNF